MNNNKLYIGKIMNRRQTTMMAVVSMALLATMMTISSPTPALAHGHWNPDGDFTLQPESESGLNDSQIKPLTADKLLPQEPAIASSNTEEVQQPVASEKIQMISIPEEVCSDGIDNDGDALIDFSDEKCNAMETQQQQQQQPILQQEPVVVSGTEICDDDLDNDFDGKVDSRDEECSYITSSTSAFPTSGRAELETDEVTEREDEASEQQQSDEDLNEESDGNENSGGKADKENDDSNDDEEDGEEDDEQRSDDEGNDDDEDDDDDDE
ncbi:MAG TPA: hypothetical protein VE544_11290 [Nitrososphaeraceae archaeon]|nr:hypothetical protein [Nitrososphaeraceae archaeon]